MQHLSISFILDLQENIFKKVKENLLHVGRLRLWASFMVWNINYQGNLPNSLTSWLSDKSAFVYLFYQTRLVYPRLDLINIDEFWQNIDYFCQKSQNACRKFPGMSFSQNKKNQRSTRSPKTCHNFIPYPYKSIKIHENPLKSLKIN